MNWRLLSRMLGLLALLVGGSMAFSLPWAFPLLGEVEQFESAGFWGLVGAMGISLMLGTSLYLTGRKEDGAILRKEALAVVGFGWMLAGILGALPFLLSGAERAPGIVMHPIDALFESISGFTTTGASVLTNLEDPIVVPRCVMFWRSFTHWLGGMGIIVLFVAILRQAGAGGKALMKREVPGPITEAVRPRVQETAMLMWSIYVGLSAIETLILWLQGLSPFDALCHTFGTMATGGFSTWNSSVGHFGGGKVEWTILVFMVLAGANFTLYYLALKRPAVGGFFSRFKPFVTDPEFRAYIAIIVVATSLLTLALHQRGLYPHWTVAGRHALFNTISVMTTTGFGTEDFTRWGEFSKAILLILMFVGGCAGSTGGGIKVIRIVLFVKSLRLEIERAFRPNVVRPLRIGDVPVDDNVRRDVTVYFGLIILVFVVAWLGLVAIEPDSTWELKGHSTDEKLIDCASAVAATLNNIGPGIGIVGPASNYTDFTLAGKSLLTVLMLLGRLELFAILVLMLPSFYRNQ